MTYKRLKRKRFKYISCYCLSILWELGICLRRNSNTSHVIVYPKLRLQSRKTFYIQIHLMLLFIKTTAVFSSPVILFKYISCYCLSGQEVLPTSLCRIQIHLMLLFILGRGPLNRLLMSIQIHLMLLFIESIILFSIAICNSNTSHVIVYPHQNPPFALNYYIQIHLMLLFIRCWTWIYRCTLDSNTSHVIVYRTAASFLANLISFKYISCYCLSGYAPRLRVIIPLFKYISCYCLSRCKLFRKQKRFIQIHLMLLFIWERFLQKGP